MRAILLLLLLAPATALAQPKPEGEAYFFTPPGSSREGKLAAAPAQGGSPLRILVTDITGKPTFCRISVVGPDGNYYHPQKNYLTPYALSGEWPKEGAWGNRRDKAPYRYLGRFFYSWGEALVTVPPGEIRVEVGKGFEHAPQVRTVRVRPGEEAKLEVSLRRTAAMAEVGYHGGDAHLHLPRVNEREEEIILDLMNAEDLAHGAILGFNEPAGPYLGFMEKMHSPQLRGLGPRSVRQRTGSSLISGQEYRSTVYGHLLLYLRDNIVFPGRTFSSDTWPVHGEVARETRGLGGVAVHAHGGYAQEIYADTALGVIDGVELLQFGVYRGIGLQDWYHIWNCGYRLPALAASDWPACRFLADCRTYVSHKGTPSTPDWLRGAAAGRSFLTTGPLVLLEVDGQPPGSRIERPGPYSCTARVRVRSEVTPVTHLHWIVNGVVVQAVPIPREKQQGDWFETSLDIPIKESSWVAVRAFSTTPGGQPDAEAHTNPISLDLNGRRVFQRASLDAWVTRLDGQIAIHRKRTFPEKARVLDYFQRARDLLLQIRERGGLRTNEDPTALSSSLEEEATRTRLAADAARPDASEAELRAFLKPVPPRSPKDALKTFETVDGFQVQVVAAEPLVRDPVAACIDEDGNLYVCEMTDYPYKPTGGQTPLGRVRLLRDPDGDGVYDTATTFAEGLLWAAGIVPWKGGVFVSAPPDIWYLKDTKGSGTADVRRKVFTGFGIDNQQAMVNNLVFGLDHHIYGATAGNGGTVRRVADVRSAPVSVGGRDFRFHPFSEDFEGLSGTVQFGNTFDDWGRRFVCSESQPLLHHILPAQVLRRVASADFPPLVRNLAPGPVPIHRISPIERWRQVRSSRRIAQGERSAEAPGASHHVVDAAAGVTLYRGGAYPPEYYGTAFVGDGQNNLIHQRRLTADGISFTSQRVGENKEFLRSSDIWFRPVNFLNAPDGTLYCLDMAREVLESIHIPLDVVKHLDLKSGREHGRIYRLAPPGFRPPPPPRLSRATLAELVATLESPHGWYRDTAHRLIFERQDPTAIEPLRQLLRKTTIPQAKVHALWSLHGLKSLDPDSLLLGLEDPHPGVRENAVTLSLLIPENPALVTRLLALVEDKEARVRLLSIFALGEFKDPQIVDTLAVVARKQMADPWMRAAVLSTPAELAVPLLAFLGKDQAFCRGAGAPLIEALATSAGSRAGSMDVVPQLQTLAALDPRFVRAFARGMHRKGRPLPLTAPIPSMLAEARKTALDSQASPATRMEAIGFLACGPFPTSRMALAALTDPSHPPAIILASVRALAEQPQLEAAEILLRGWRGYNPEVRAEVVHALLSRDLWTLAFLRAATSGQASVSSIDPTRRDLLLRHRRDDIRALAMSLFTGTNPTRTAILAEYRTALSLPADLGRGATLFERTCATCHQLSGKGHAVGPLLTVSSTGEGATLLGHILDPNAYVAPNYVQYLVTDRRGRTRSGLLAAQSAAGITLRRDGGITELIPHGEIEEVTSTGRSLMPEGLEATLSKQDMADLIGYVKDAVARAAKDPVRERDFGTLPGLLEPGRP